MRNGVALVAPLPTGLRLLRWPPAKGVLAHEGMHGLGLRHVDSQRRLSQPSRGCFLRLSPRLLHPGQGHGGERRDVR